MKSKAEVRRCVRMLIKEIPVDAKDNRSAHICATVAALDAVRSARVVALFSPLPDEPDISQLIVKLSERCTVLLPRIEGDSMNFYEYNPDRLSAGAFGIMEPVDGTAVSPSEIDAMVVPGLAFTVAGQRMGRGRGYYDKYLSLMGFRAYKIGVCYSEQLFDMLPCEPHDIIMDKVVAG